MLSPSHPALPRRVVAFALALAGVCVFTLKASAQEQERKLLDRIQHPNMSLHAEGFEKSFETKASTGDRQAAVRPFAFGSRTASAKSFQAPAFNDGRRSFHAENYAVKRATAVDQQALPQADRTFATGTVPVRTDRAANRSVDSRDYVNSTKPYLVPGKRQDNLDELRGQKNLTVDQIREILNKSR